MIKVSNIEEKAIKRFKEAESAYRKWLHKSVHTGNGLIEQINKRGLNKAPLFLVKNFKKFFVRV